MSNSAPEQNTASPSIAIQLNGIRVAYRSYNQPPSSLKEALLRVLRTGKRRHYSTFDALGGVSLEIPKGAVFGLVGSNGSGKSTLLKVIARVLKPVEGSVAINGTVASLIELGAGFDPELNAIENIYLHGSLHKKTRKEIESTVHSILDFAELHEFANTPVKYYSSGMFARLGFSAAIQINPDILLVDEILAVGDERFQAKCDAVFQSFLRAGKTIVIVSHSADMMKSLCSQIALLSKGKVVYSGDPQTAVDMYRSRSYETALK